MKSLSLAPRYTRLLSVLPIAVTLLSACGPGNSNEATPTQTREPAPVSPAPTPTSDPSLVPPQNSAPQTGSIANFVGNYAGTLYFGPNAQREGYTLRIEDSQQQTQAPGQYPNTPQNQPQQLLPTLRFIGAGADFTVELEKRMDGPNQSDPNKWLTVFFSYPTTKAAPFSRYAVSLQVFLMFQRDQSGRLTLIPSESGLWMKDCSLSSSNSCTQVLDSVIFEKDLRKY